MNMNIFEVITNVERTEQSIKLIFYLTESSDVDSVRLEMCENDFQVQMDFHGFFYIQKSLISMTAVLGPADCCLNLVSTGSVGYEY